MADVLTRNLGREAIVRATMLSLVSGRPAFFLGSPGINKTGTVQDIARRIDGAVFYDALMPAIVSVEQLIVESTSIEELPAVNGGKSIRTHDKIGRAAAAHIVFADEVWKADPRVLQTTLDLAKGDGIRWDGQTVKTPLLAFVAASNELPEPEGNLGALWSRMTIRAEIKSLDRTGKKNLVAARLNRAQAGKSAPASATLTLVEVETLREVRPFVEVSDEIVEITLDLYQQLLDGDNAGFAWLWADDRRFGRCFDVLQANALLDGRVRVGKQDLRVLEYLLWDTPEQIATVKAKIAPLCRTPMSDAQELFDTLFAPGGVIAEALAGNRDKIVAAITQFEEAEKDLGRLAGEASHDEKTKIAELLAKVGEEKQNAVAAILGAKRSNK
ncbi:AAA family ATPase [Patescibacteria group bacterium]|nr:AAA family ATPase [Patescibacteria group bacterium]MDE2011119.1 AAA family ATPase [Patescibacteria group bacterium]